MTLIEILVTIAIMAVVLSVAIPTVSGVMHLQQVGVAKELAQTYRFLRDEAALRNVTFRIAYDLDARTYTIEVGDPRTLIFTSPDELEEYQDQLEEEASRYTQNELDEGEGEDETAPRFMGLDSVALNTTVELPGNSYFAWVYTPQYGEPIEPSVDWGDPDFDPEDMDPDAPHTIVYTYIFANGFAEHALIRIADMDDPEEGFTLEVEPLSGVVRLHDEIVGVDDIQAYDPEEAPDVPL